MPDLPEVEAARREIEEHCVGKKIKRCFITDDPRILDGVSRSEFEASLFGKTIVSARRKGKHLWLVLDSPPFPTFQFGTDGAIYIKGVAVMKYRRFAVNDADEWPSKYTKLFIEFDHGLELSFTDKRRLAKIRLLKDPIAVPPISELGPDSLFESMTVNEFTTSLNKRRSAIKFLLVNQVSVKHFAKSLQCHLAKPDCAFYGIGPESACLTVIFQFFIPGSRQTDKSISLHCRLPILDPGSS